MTRVLVIDDDVAVAEVLRVVLEEGEFEVTVLSGPSDVPTKRFDCIVTDLVGMRLYSFAEAREWVVRVADAYPDTPVIVATAHSRAGRDAERLGVQIITKPFEVDELIALVREVTS